jgi:Ras-related C3 botulinum toxin substrate 1
MQAIKVVVAGDGSVGKTCFMISFTYKAFPQEYIPTVFDNYNALMECEGRTFNLGLWDTAGQSDFEKLRPMSYEGADIFLLFYSIINPTSFENIKEKWYGEIRQHGANTPVLLVGTKVDKKDDPEVLEKLRLQKQEPVSESQVKKLAKEIGAVSYLTCSAKYDQGMQRIFEEVVRTVVNAKMGKKPGKQCWSINCRKTLPAVSGPKKYKCSSCSHWYCSSCIEVWEDGWKGCPQCTLDEAAARKRKGDKLPEVKKKYIQKEDKIEFSSDSEESIDEPVSNTNGPESPTAEKKEKKTKKLRSGSKSKIVDSNSSNNLNASAPNNNNNDEKKDKKEEKKEE